MKLVMTGIMLLGATTSFATDKRQSVYSEAFVDLNEVETYLDSVGGDQSLLSDEQKRTLEVGLNLKKLLVDQRNYKISKSYNDADYSLAMEVKEDTERGEIINDCYTGYTTKFYFSNIETGQTIGNKIERSVLKYSVGYDFDDRNILKYPWWDRNVDKRTDSSMCYYESSSINDAIQDLGVVIDTYKKHMPETF